MIFLSKITFLDIGFKIIKNHPLYLDSDFKDLGTINEDSNCFTWLSKSKEA